ncbi:MAG: YggT family protein [Thermodesulfovibrio sp.]|nr:YggT family protein [Thermodesulfovibrio sp.]
MFGDFILVMANVVDILLTVYSFIVIAAAILSWFNLSPYHPIVRFLYSVTEPVLKPIRRILRLRLPIDISPLILLIIIYFIQKFLIMSLIELGYRVKGGSL